MRYTVTAALPYANGPIHIGHLAGVYIPADVYVRYLRLKGEDVIFICGSDEHGVAISIRAGKEGKTPKEIVDIYHNLIKSSFANFGISFDNYSRTSKKIQHETASAFFTTLYDKGCFEEKVSEQLFDEKANQFLADRFVVGTCPKCEHPEAYGDQCEGCGTSLSPKELINPMSAITQTKPTLKSTKHWYLPLKKYESFLKKWILKPHKDDWKTNVYGQVKGWINDGLLERAVTRDLEWGIPVPLKQAKGKVLYVWFEAPIGYISSTKEWANANGKDWEPYWKDKDTKLIHFIGKDNIVFHCIIFPAILKAEGSYILPENVPANEFLNLEGQKLSTSKNHAVWLHEYLKDFPNKKDELRYVLISNTPETKDADFTWKDFQAKVNNELVAIFGNFVNRVIVLTHKYYGGKVPHTTTILTQDKEVLKALKNFPIRIGKLIELYRFREAQQEMMNIARMGNKYLADEMPWKLFKSDPERVHTIMNIAIQITAILSFLSKPFLPFTSAKLLKTLKIKEDNLNWETATESGILNGGHDIGKIHLLFEKIEDSMVSEETKKLQKTTSKNKKMETKSIDFSDFKKLDLRVGKIVSAEKMENADKLLIFKVELGKGEIRTIVSGIAESYSANEILGKYVTVLTNLRPRKVRGVLSEGMLLLAENEEEKFVFINPDSKQVQLGNKIS
ncbi:methionine--tRNA ligase [Elysia marginata]|uniref:Methionine--tRNA ligase n=1 Tax=Elysia marginata TaxID=1093978 RepID=A0AAV4G7K8_9GAST|nr:methionine--tRNA ligase [Elysia marginata]